VGAPQHGPLALGALLGPVAPVGQPPGRLALPGDLGEPLEGQAGVGDDAEVGGEDPADLGGLDVDVDEAAPAPVDLEAAGVAVGPAVADAEHQVGREQVGVAVALAGLEPGHAGHQPVVVGNGPPAHQGGDDRDPDQLGELHQQVGGVGVDDPAAGHDQRPLGRLEHVQGLLGLDPGRRRLVDRQGLVGVDVEVDLGHLDVEGQVDQDRARPAGPHQVERLLERARHLGRLQHGHGQLGDRLGDGGDVDRLEVLLVQPRDRRLAGDAQDRDRVGRRRVEPGEHVGAGRSGGADADADIAGGGAGVALGHVGGPLDVAGQHVGDGAALA
jgi:hypothetical protein